MLLGQPEDLSIADWKAHTVYHGYGAKSRVIKRFWKVVESLSDDERRRLLFFATAVTSLPLAGFAGLQSRFHIHRADCSLDRLPTAHTCFFQLVLPPYPSWKVMRRSLLTITQEEVSQGYGMI